MVSLDFASCETRYLLQSYVSKTIMYKILGTADIMFKDLKTIRYHILMTENLRKYTSKISNP